MRDKSEEVIAYRCKHLGHHTKIGLKRIIFDAKYSLKCSGGIVSRQLWLKGMGFWPERFSKAQQMIYCRQLGIKGYQLPKVRLEPMSFKQVIIARNKKGKFRKLSNRSNTPKIVR